MSYGKSEKAVYVSPTEKSLPVPQHFNADSQNLGNPMYVKKNNSNNNDSYDNPNFYASLNQTEPNVYEGIPYFEKGKQGQTHGNYDYARNSEIPLGANGLKIKKLSESDSVQHTVGYAPLMNIPHDNIYAKSDIADSAGDYTTLPENVRQETYAELRKEDTYAALNNTEIAEEDSYETLSNSADKNKGIDFSQSQYVGW